jgi:hypothetical protein
MYALITVRGSGVYEHHASLRGVRGFTDFILPYRDNRENFLPFSLEIWAAHNLDHLKKNESTNLALLAL